MHGRDWSVIIIKLLALLISHLFHLPEIPATADPTSIDCEKLDLSYNQTELKPPETAKNFIPILESNSFL